MQRGIRYRLYPTKEQALFLTRNAGCCRKAYNECLSFRKLAYDADDEEGTMSFLCHYIGDQRFRSFLINDSISLKQYKFLMDLTETLRKSGGIFTKSWPSDMKVSTMDALVQFIRAVNQRLLFETGNETFIFDTDRILTDIETHNGEKEYTVTIKARKI